MKGMYGSRLHTACDDVLSEIGLTEKRHALASTLSGMMITTDKEVVDMMGGGFDE